MNGQTSDSEASQPINIASLSGKERAKIMRQHNNRIPWCSTEIKNNGRFIHKMNKYFLIVPNMEMEKKIKIPW